jgi:predicted PurR-regulated permease PerM
VSRRSDAESIHYRRWFLVLVTLGVSGLFLAMIAPFLLAVLVAAILSGMLSPLHGWLTRRAGGRRRLAAAVTVFGLFLLVLLPLSGFLALVVAEGLQLGQGTGAWVQEQGPRFVRLRARLDAMPVFQYLVPEGPWLAERAREFAGRAGSVLVGGLAAATKGTLAFLIQLFVALYAVYYFLLDGRDVVERVLDQTPLRAEERVLLIERFQSVARATLRGSLLIGVIQGALAGLAFWVGGIPAPAFWGAVMVILSVIPAVGAGLVWVPAVIWLMMTGSLGAALGVGLWCALVVGTADNFLRPRLIGRDARMPDLLILLSTLGGLTLFGAPGFLLGPIVAALFLTVWGIYGHVFEELLTGGGKIEGGPGASS